jgi:hypothetical protein
MGVTTAFFARCVGAFAQDGTPGLAVMPHSWVKVPITAAFCYNRSMFTPYSAVTNRARGSVKFESPLTANLRSRTMTVTGLSVGEATGEI